MGASWATTYKNGNPRKNINWIFVPLEGSHWVIQDENWVFIKKKKKKKIGVTSTRSDQMDI